MTVVRLIIALIAGPIVGALLGFGVPLIAMSVDGSPRTGGSFGMREVIVMVPAG